MAEGLPVSHRQPRAAWCETPAGLAALALAFALLLFSRKPDVLLHAELWGDDGWSWYPDAYRLGLKSLLLPVGGYLNTFQRLVGLAGQVLPLTWVPTLFAAAGLIVELLPAVFLVSPRMRQVVPSLGLRLLLAFVLMAMPNTIELYANLTNAQWNLALLAFMVLLASPPRGPVDWLFDGWVLAISGLSGPFCLLLLPVSLWQVLERRDRADVSRLALLGAMAAIQLWFLLHNAHGARSAAPLGAGIVAFSRIVSAQIFLGAELGYRTVSGLPQRAFWQHAVWPLTVTAACAAIGAVALVRGRPPLRKLALFAALVLAGGLLSPQVSVTEPQWPVMGHPPMGNRYFAFPMVAWLGVLATLCADRYRAWRSLGYALAAVMLMWAIPRDWAELRFPPTDFQAKARAFATAAPGTLMDFPLVPPGLTPMFLLKKPP